MKRIFILLFTTFFFSGGVFAQGLAFFYDGVQLADGTEITITKAEDSFYGLQMESGLKIKNLTDSDIFGKVIQDVITVPTAGSFSFCFGTCFVTNENLSLETVVAPGNEDTLHLLFEPEENQYTTAKAIYTATNNNVLGGDPVSVIVTYEYTETSASINGTELNKDIKAYQIGGNMYFSYSLDTPEAKELEVYSLAGYPIAKYNLVDVNGVFVLPVSLSKGVYVYRIGDYTDKFIVK